MINYIKNFFKKENENKKIVKIKNTNTNQSYEKIDHEIVQKMKQQGYGYILKNGDDTIILFFTFSLFGDNFYHIEIVKEENILYNKMNNNIINKNDDEWDFIIKKYPLKNVLEEIIFKNFPTPNEKQIDFSINEKNNLIAKIIEKKI